MVRYPAQGLLSGLYTITPHPRHRTLFIHKAISTPPGAYGLFGLCFYTVRKLDVDNNNEVSRYQKARKLRNVVLEENGESQLHGQIRLNEKVLASVEERRCLVDTVPEETTEIDWAPMGLGMAVC